MADGILTWTLQTKTRTATTWVCRVGYVHESRGRVSWGLWGKHTYTAQSVDAAKAALEEAYAPEYMRLLEEGIAGEWGPCIKCGESKLGTQQEGGEVLCLTCQGTTYRRDLRL